MTDWPPRVVVATANAGKAAEMHSVLVASGAPVELVPRPDHVPDVDETGATLEDNARLKARALVAATGLPALADDTGLEVDALGGLPGVRSARYAGEHARDADNVAKLLAAMTEAKRASRTARFRTVVVLAWPGGREVVAAGVVEGVIGAGPVGDGGFGYDPVFLPAGGGGRTFAEMPAAEKDAISHRGRALRSLVAEMRDAVPRSEPRQET